MPKVTINVTQDHIDAAAYLLSVFETHCMRRAECCPLALALRTQGYPDAIVSERLVFLSKTHRAWLPPGALDFRMAYDRGDDVEPASFEFDLPW